MTILLAAIAVSFHPAPVSLATNADTAICSTPAPAVAETLAAEDEPSTTIRLLYMNRCTGGCVIMPGSNNSIANTSTIVQQTSSFAEFEHGDKVWDDTMACMRDMFSRFNINITDVDPGNQPHYEMITAGLDSDAGQFGALGVAPASCTGTPNAIAFTFASLIGPYAQSLCEVAAQEAGHAFGLEHQFLCEDPMTYLTDCAGPKTFQDVDSPCGELSEFPCTCGETQNSVQHLLAFFGPGGQPPTADVAIESVIESPDNSNGDGILTPGEEVLVNITLSNAGNSAVTDGALKISASGFAASGLQMPVVDPGFVIQHSFAAEVKPSACGKNVDFGVVSEVGDKTSSATISVPVGLEKDSVVQDFATAADWSKNLDGNDSVTTGEWEFGVPGETFFAGRTLQPGNGPSGNGDSAWMTGLGEEWDLNSLVGKSSLSSTTLDLSSWYSVTGIRYTLWYLALDRPNATLVTSPDPHLTVEISGDDGKTWKVIDEVVSEPVRWVEREVSVADFHPTSTVRLRFTASNDTSVDSRIVEVGIDSVTLLGGGLLCEPTEEAGGCGIGGSGNDGFAVAWPLGLAMLAMWFRRRTLA